MMTSRELLALAETRLLALDEEVVQSGSFTVRAAVAGELRDLALARAQHELIRLQAAELSQRLTRANAATAIADHAGQPRSLRNWELP